MRKLNFLHLFIFASVLFCFVGPSISWPAFGVQLFPFRLLSIIGFVVIALRGHSISCNGLLCYAIIMHAVMVVYGLASLLWSPDAVLGFQNWAIFLTGFLFVLLFTAACKGEFRTLPIWMRGWSVALLLTGLLGLYEFISGEYIFVFDERSMPAFARLAEKIGWTCPRVFCPNPNNFAFVNAISIFPVLGWALERQNQDRFLGIAAAMAGVLMVILSYSRAALGGIVIGIAIFCFILALLHKKRILNSYSVVIVVSVVVGFYVYWDDLEFLSRAMLAIVDKVETTDDYYRVFTYLSAFNHGTILSSGFGKGLGASTLIIDGKSYHHHLLEILAEFGLWVFLLNAILMVRLVMAFWNNIRQGKSVYLNLGFLASWLIFPLLCAGPSGIFGEGVYWLWLILGLLVTTFNEARQWRSAKSKIQVD